MNIPHKMYEPRNSIYDFSYFGRQVSSSLCLFRPDDDDIEQSESVRQLELDTYPENVCVDLECRENITYELPKTDPKIDWDTKELQIYNVEKTVPTNVYMRICEKRKREHEEILNKMKACMLKINSKMETEMRNQSKYIKSYIQQIYEECEKCISNEDICGENALYVKEDTFKKIEKTIAKYDSNRNIKIDLFVRFLEELEKHRTGIFKELLRAAYKSTTDVHYLLPYKLQEYFEYEILKINQITINNFHYYNKLRNQLKSINENDMRQWIHRIDQMKQDWIIYIENSNRKKKRISIEEVRSQDSVLTLQVSSICNTIDSLYNILKDEVTREEIDKWLQCAETNLIEYDFEVKTLICILKVLNTSIFYRFLQELEEISSKMVMMRKPSISTQQLKTVLKQNSYSFLHYKHDLRQLQILWKKRFGNIETDIADSKRFIKCVTILWDEHFGRVSDLQTFIRMDLENVISKNTYQAETAEYKFNLIVDKIRQQPTEQKLMKTLAEAYKYLNSLENMYSTHDKTEIAAVEKYMDYIKVETEILRAEVKRFLNIFTIDPYYDPKSQRPRASRTNLLEDPTECLIASDIQYCQYETDLLKNWMFGIWDALDNYWANCIEELLEEAKAYVNSKIENIKEKTAIKRAFNKTRFDRIKHSIYMRRLEEINIHQERITIHQQGIDDGIQKLKQKMLIVENRLKQKVSDYHEDLSKQSKYIGKLSDSKQILVCMKIMNQGNIVTKEEMKKVVDNFKKKCDDFLDDIKYSDLEFRKTIRLFSEEGTFSSDEAKDVVKKLTKIEKKAIKALDSLFKELKKQESKYGDSLDKVILNIQDETSNCMEAFQHNEKTVSIITDLQKHIQEDVYEVKFSMKKQMDSIEDMKEEMRKNLGEMDICEKYETDLKNNIRSLETMKKYLMHPEPVTAIKNLTLCKLLENDKAAEEQSESHSNSEAIIEDIYGFNTDEMKDYTSLLFDKKPVEEDNYLSKLNSRLYKTFQTIQTSARAFYGGHSNEVMEGVSTDKVQPTYSRFMEEICQKYKCYQIQYEMNWIDNVNNFVNSVQSLTSFTKKYNSDFLDSIRHNTKNKLKINHNFINDNMMNHLNEIENNYMSIHNKLKVLHGHPNNKHLLDELHMEMKMLKDANTDKLQLMAEPLKENYISEYNDLIQKFETAANFFKSFTENIDALAGFTDDLEKQVDTKIKLTEEYIAANKPFQADHELNLDKLFTNLLSKVRPSAKSSGKSETSQIFEDMKDHWEEYYQKNVKDLEAIMKNHLEQVDHTVVKDPIIHDKYQSMWESDIKKISDMYSVKYSK